MNYEHFMKQAIIQAKKAELIDEVPVGAIIIKDNEVISRGYNKREKLQIATKHAEIIAIEKACKKLGTWHLDDCTMFVTMEPCLMCAGAIINSRINKVVYGAKDTRIGCIEGKLNVFDIKEFNHQPQYIGGILEKECSNILKTYFKNKR